MRALVLGIAALASALAGPAAAAPSWLVACHAEGAPTVELSRPDAAQVLLDPEGEARIDRSTDQVGSQFVAGIATGTAVIVELDGRHVELPWICLLEPDDRVVFFRWLTDLAADPLEHCGQGGRTRDESIACLNNRLESAERGLGAARDRLGEDPAARSALEASDAAWRGYRDAECARRAGTMADPDAAALACRTVETRERTRELNLR